jgi:hypothetical protein
MTIPASRRTTAVVKQLEALRQMQGSRAVFVLPWLFVVLAGALGVASWHYREGGFVLFAGFAALLATVLRVGIPHIHRAVAALDSARPIVKRIEIRQLPDYDSPHFEASIPSRGRTAWKIRFPQTDWTPVEGFVDAEIYHHPEVPWPALVITPIGIIWPRSKPQANLPARDR